MTETLRQQTLEPSGGPRRFYLTGVVQAAVDAATQPPVQTASPLMFIAAEPRTVDEQTMSPTRSAMHWPGPHTGMR